MLTKNIILYRKVFYVYYSSGCVLEYDARRCDASAHVLRGEHVVCVNHARTLEQRFRNGGRWWQFVGTATLRFFTKNKTVLSFVCPRRQTSYMEYRQ